MVSKIMLWALKKVRKWSTCTNLFIVAIVLMVISYRSVLISYFDSDYHQYNFTHCGNVVAQSKPTKVRVMILPTVINLNEPIDTVIIVKSSVDEFQQRNMVRTTWAGGALDIGMVVIFSVGYSENKTINKLVLNESLKHRDIFQTNVLENYHHFVLKTYTTLHWLNSLKIKVLFFTDSDIIIFPSQLYKFTKKLATMNNTISGLCWTKPTAVVRDPTSKSFVPKSVWSEDTYPPFCSGGAYLMTGDVPGKLLRAIPSGTNNWRWAYKMDLIEDVVFTGVLRTAANVTLEPSEKFVKFGSHSSNPCFGAYRLISYSYICLYPAAAIINSFKPPAMYEQCWTSYNSIVKTCHNSS